MVGTSCLLHRNITAGHLNQLSRCSTVPHCAHLCFCLCLCLCPSALVPLLENSSVRQLLQALIYSTGRVDTKDSLQFKAPQACVCDSLPHSSTATAACSQPAHLGRSRPRRRWQFEPSRLVPQSQFLGPAIVVFTRRKNSVPFNAFLSLCVYYSYYFACAHILQVS